MDTQNQGTGNSRKTVELGCCCTCPPILLTPLEELQVI